MQNTTLSLEIDGICVQCIFANASPADGCYIKVTCRDTITSTELIRHDNSDSVEGCIVDIDSGAYNISIYDINHNGTIGATPAIVYRDIMFAKQPSSSIVTPTITDIITVTSVTPTIAITGIITVTNTMTGIT